MFYKHYQYQQMHYSIYIVCFILICSYMCRRNWQCTIDIFRTVHLLVLIEYVIHFTMDGMNKMKIS